MTTTHTADRIDRMILAALRRAPDSSMVAIADATGLSRNTVRARLSRYAREGVLFPFDRRVDPAFLGFPLRAYVFTSVRQRKLDEVGAALTRIREVVSVDGLSGSTDLLIHVVARDAEDLYRTAARILSIDGVKRTETGLVMRSLVEYRMLQVHDDRSGSAASSDRPGAPVEQL